MDDSEKNQLCNQGSNLLSLNLKSKRPAAQQATNRDAMQFPRLEKMPTKIFKSIGRTCLALT